MQRVLEQQMDMKQVSKYTTQDNTGHNNSRNSQYRNSTNTVSEISCVNFQRIQNCLKLYTLKFTFFLYTSI